MWASLSSSARVSRGGRGNVLARESDIGDVGGAELMWCADEDGFCFRAV